MNRGFYPRLAWTGMKQNRRLYLPYLLTCTGVTAVFYILMGLSVSSVLPQMSGGRSTALIMSLGSMVIAFFALIFLFYTHSFLIRRRSREFGLYNVLGMGKGNIARVLLWETLLSCGATTLIGLALGILLSKLAEAALLNLLHLQIAYTFTVSIPSLLVTLGLFAAIHALIFLRSLWELHRVSAVALLRSESVGEKPPRARWALAVLGIALLGGAYWLAVSIREPLEALTWFFVAVIMVIVGTYLLFITGSVALCRMLQKNPRYYYQPRHFVSVSSMAYRMKRNGAGLASICVLATMVLVMLSSTTCMYYGVEDALHQRYPRDIGVECYFGDRLGGGVSGGQPQRLLRRLRRPVLSGYHAQRGVLTGRRLHHLLQAGLRGLRGPEPLRHHAEGGHDEAGHPPQHQLPAAHRVFPAHGTVLSGVHLCFAFPFIHKLLLLFNLSNTSLLIGTTVVSYVAFALLYTLAYKLTSNAYYHIVSGAAERE